MDGQPHNSFQSPSRKVRKLDAVHSSPSRLSDLLAIFGAKKSPTSVSKMQSRGLRPLKDRFSYAESEGSEITPQSSPNSSAGELVLGSLKAPITLDDTDSEHELQTAVVDPEAELQSDDDVIQVAPRRSTFTRELPYRATRSNVSYATPKKVKLKRNISPTTKGKAKSMKLASDLFSTAQSKPATTETERSKIHLHIAKITEPKRNAFLLANREYFLPLLPENNYITKLERLQNMSKDTAVDLSPCVKITINPKGVLATMKPYQLDGLSFLVYMQQNGMSAILGDEMGLGKTLQTLSLFQHLKNSEPLKSQTRPFLVICPLSVLSSWMNEAKKWVPGLAVVRFHGPKKEREMLKGDCRNPRVKIDVIVTTYESFVAEQNWFKRVFVWRYCVLDEGHKIKNSKSDVAQALQSLNAEYRLLLTGTPLQNNLSELWALFHWLYPEVFDERTADNFKRAFDLGKGKVSTTFMDHARTLLELVMLRRLKCTPGVELGLPPKEEILLHVPLTPMQRFWYTRLLTKADKSTLDDLFKNAKAKEMQTLRSEVEEDAKQSSLTANVLAEGELSYDVWSESRDIIEKAIQNEQGGSKQSEWQKLMNLILQLRKVCSHPYILPHAGPDPYYLGDHIKTASGKFIVLDKLVDELVVKQGKKILIFAGLTKTLDLCEDMLYLKGAIATSGSGFRYLRLDGSTARARRNLGIRLFNDMESEFKVMLISTRAGGLGINLASASDVVFLDEDWNPQVTIQAEARAHRIGQTQKVTVYKLLATGTVEEQMLGRIRKKLYLSTKITESMRSVHSTADPSRKRKRESSEIGYEEEEGPQLDTTSLRSLIRRGAQTLTRPVIDVTDMLGWDWETTLRKCKDEPFDDALTADHNNTGEEEAWLNSMERVECLLFEGKKHQRQTQKDAEEVPEFARADRRVGKNTTVMIDGFAINKDSLTCGDWEAVPTMAGKDPRLAEPVRAKKEAINNQDLCQHCRLRGSLVPCSGCPRSYHLHCLDGSFQQKTKRMTFYCPQHECVDCKAKTSDAGGLIYRCRWCDNGYCEDCLDWDMAILVGETLPEYEILQFETKENAWYIECPSCIRRWKADKSSLAGIRAERRRIDDNYELFSANGPGTEMSDFLDNTPETISEVSTPRYVEMELPKLKKTKMS